MKKFHAVKFNLNEEISHSKIQLEFDYVESFQLNKKYSTKLKFILYKQ